MLGEHMKGTQAPALKQLALHCGMETRVPISAALFTF